MASGSGQAAARAALRGAPKDGTWCSVETALGTFFVAANQGVLIQSGLPGATPEGFLGELVQRHPGLHFREALDDPLLRRAAKQLQEYATGSRTTFDLPLKAEGTEFQKRVWAALQTIPYGQTWTYGQLAQGVGRPSAFRAVGQANHENPLAPFIPCHRVVEAGGGIGGYGGGASLKRRLLRREGVAFEDEA
ncbi:MAG: methylated-DNA--[protein]-cysteine S-methyltransferase [Thermoplasmatota archaeon]